MKIKQNKERGGENDVERERRGSRKRKARDGSEDEKVGERKDDEGGERGRRQGRENDGGRQGKGLDTEMKSKREKKEKGERR